MAASGSARARRSPASRNRRRQRSVRVTVAVTLLGLGTVGVLAALPTRSVFWLSVASVLGIVLAWAALRIMWTEVLQSRRENAADRAASAKAYRELFTVRAAEHAEFTTAMTERLAEAQLGRRDLEGLLSQAQDRALRAERKLVAESRALEESRARVLRLEQALAVGLAEEAGALAARETLSRSRPHAAFGAPRSG